MREDGLARKKWSVCECRFLTDNGLLEPGMYELIEGEIVYKMGQSRPHIITISHIIRVLALIFGLESLQNQAQIGIGERDESTTRNPMLPSFVEAWTIILTANPTRQPKFSSSWKRPTAA